MRLELILLLAMLAVAVVADTKLSFNITQAMAKSRANLDKPQSLKKPAYLRITPEDRKKLSLFPKNTLKYVATTKAPMKMLNNESRRKHSVLFPKMAKQVLVTSPGNIITEAPLKVTTMYNFKPTRAPKGTKRFSNNPLYATSTPSIPLKRIPKVYRNDLYERNSDGLKAKSNRLALFSRKTLNNDHSGESQQEKDSDIVLNKASSILRQDTNNFNDEEETGDKYVSKEENENTEEDIASEENVEQSDFDEHVDSAEIEPEPTVIDEKKNINKVTLIKEHMEQGNRDNGANDDIKLNAESSKES